MEDIEKMVKSIPWDIISGLYEHQEKAINNFQLKLPEVQSDLAEQTLKDTYHFDSA